jgi:outer membrane protein assembly factor BamB
MARIRWVVLFFFLGVQGCTYVDNYWLGKDNAPVPEPLAPLTSTMTWTPCWTVSFGKPISILSLGRTSKETYLRLKPVLDGNMIYAASHQGMIKAIHRDTGKVQWSKQLPSRLVSGPTVKSGALVLATENAEVLVLSKQDGHERWRARVSGEVLATPLITEGRVVVKTIDGYVYAFDLKTGTKLWAVDHGTSPLVLKASSSPVRHGNDILAGFSDGKLDAIELETGRMVWQRSMAYARGASDVERLVDISTDPIVRGDAVYLASYQGYWVAMSLLRGEFIWSKPASTYRNLAMNTNTLYMTDSKDVIWARNKNNGQVQWKQPALQARGVTEPVLIGKYILLGDNMGVLHLLDAKRGDLIARYSLESSIIVGPLVEGNHMYVMTASGQLHCFTLKD